MIVYQTRQGDTVDYIAWKHYGRTQETVESIFRANPELADQGPVLPPGLLVFLPDNPEPDRQRVIRLWD